MSSDGRHPPETPEGAAWELFMEIRRGEETAERARGSSVSARARLLDLYAECLAVTTGRRRETSAGARLH